MTLPQHLARKEATGIALNEPIAQFECGNYKNFIYLILSWKDRLASVVDPQEDVDTFLVPLKNHGFTLKEILLTHTHFDHIAGVPELLRRFPNLRVRVHKNDQHRLSKISPESILLVQDDDHLSVGSLKVHILHTPGHSSGEACYLVEAPQPYLLTGDTLFIRDCGRTDLEGGSNEEMFNSLQRLKSLPPNTILLPGHHYQRECATTLAAEMEQSPPMRCQSVAELANLP